MQNTKESSALYLRLATFVKTVAKIFRWEIKRKGICMRPMKNDMVGITETSMRILLGRIDLACLASGLILFFLFNVVYWIIALL